MDWLLKFPARVKQEEVRKGNKLFIYRQVCQYTREKQTLHIKELEI